MLDGLVDLFKDKVQFLETIYNDGAQKGVKQVGLALENVLSVTNTFTLPLKYWGEKKRLTLEKNMELYRKKLEHVDEAAITQVTPELGVPLLEKFTYVTNEEIANLFANLLAKASVTNTAALGHPGFLHIIENLSADEAKIVQQISTLNTRGFIPFISYNLHFNNSDNQTGYIEIARHRTGIELDIHDLLFQDNIGLYLDNLTSLGVLICKEDGIITPEKMYLDLQTKYSDLAQYIQSRYVETGEYKFMNISRGHYLITDYGFKFIQAVCENQH